MVKRRLGALLFLLSTCGACALSTQDAVCLGVATVESPIYGGAQDAGTSLEPDAGAPVLSEAIGALHAADGRLLCTATRIAPGWALTAAHCVNDEAAERFVTDGISAAIGEIRVHAAHDAALLALTEPALPSPAHIPLGVSAAEKLRAGAAVVLAGRGLTETNASGELRVVTERMIERATGTFIVDGAGKSGACHGDSGGPLLVHRVVAEAHATHRADCFQLIGILSRGSASCTGLDEYVSIGALADWLTPLRALRACR